MPWLTELALRSGLAKHYGPGENIWSNVHIDDLVDLYLPALEAAPRGAFYFAENGANAMKDICVAINRKLRVHGGTVAMSLEETIRKWAKTARRTPWVPTAAFARFVPGENWTGARIGRP